MAHILFSVILREQKAIIIVISYLNVVDYKLRARIGVKVLPQNCTINIDGKVYDVKSHNWRNDAPSFSAVDLICCSPLC